MKKFQIQNLTSFVSLIVICLSWLLVSNCLAQDVVTAKDLIENSQSYDGKTIIYQGEAVGDIMKRGNFFWVNVLDSSAAIGVWAPIKFRPLIRFIGGYGTRGDYLQIKGTFNARCKLHAGELDIHAQEIKVIETGQFLSKRINPERKRIALYMSVVALCLMILAIYKSRR